MEEKNELGDIILNKGSSQGGSKKVILAVATLGIILIVVVLLMNTLNSENQNNIPQAALPPKPAPAVAQNNVQKEEPLFEDVEVIDEEADTEDQKLEEIAKKLKEESRQESDTAPVVKEEKKTTKPKAVHKVTQKPQPKVAVKGRYYVQVGSFSISKPNKKFLASIKNEGYDYTFHKATVRGKKVTKVLVGPFRSEKEARSALRNIKKRLVKDAFLIKL